MDANGLPARRRVLGWLHRRAENVVAAMLAVMFLAFMVQIVFRYFLNFPIGWTSELTIIMWLWGVLFGAAFVLRDSEEIRFDVFHGAAGRRARRAMGLLTALAVIVLYAMSFKPTFDYVAFMKVQKTAYLGIRFDWLYSIYVVFVVAVLLRYLWMGWRLLRGADDTDEGDRVASGL